MVDPFFRPVAATAAGTTSFDAGLRQHMQRVYNYMAGGLVVTGGAAYIVAHTALAGIIFGSPLKWLVMLGPLAFMFFMPGMARYTVGQTKALFWSFCVVMGLSLSTIFFAYSETSIARAFFITAADFGAMSLYGYVTKRDLTGLGGFMMMGLIGVLLASVGNLVLMLLGTPSPALIWVVSVVSVIVFTGLTAFHVQRIKESYNQGWGREANDKLAINGALSLYLDFINLFVSLLQLTGNRRG